MPRIANRFAIWDLDNCLSDDSTRISSIDWARKGNKRYEQYHSEALLDMPNKAAVELFKEQEYEGIIPIIFTGRPIRWEDDTDIWIAEHLQPRAGKVMKMMRGKEDERESTPLKESMLNVCIRCNIFQITQVVAAYDDRKPIIDMYKARGIAGAKVMKANAMCAYTNPFKKEKL